MERISVHVPDEQISKVERIVERTGQTDLVPYTKKAEILRLIFEAGMDQLEAGEVELDGVELRKLLE